MIHCSGKGVCVCVCVCVWGGGGGGGGGGWCPLDMVPGTWYSVVVMCVLSTWYSVVDRWGCPSYMAV